MAPKSRQSRVQEVLTAIGLSLHRGAFYTQEAILEAVSPHTDGDVAFTLRIVEASVSQGVLGHSGIHYLFRRAPDHEDFVDICKAEGIDLPSPSEALEPGVEELSRAILNLPNLESRLLQLQQNVENLKAVPQFHHWLTLSLPRMPRDVRDALKLRAQQIVGTQAKPDEVERHMVLIAAQILVHALRVPRKPTVRGIIPVDAGDPAHE